MRLRFRVSIVVVVASVTLSGCATKPLKAPCSPDEGGQPMAYAPVMSTPDPFRALGRPFFPHGGMARRKGEEDREKRGEAQETVRSRTERRRRP